MCPTICKHLTFLFSLLPRRFLTKVFGGFPYSCVLPSYLWIRLLTYHIWCSFRSLRRVLQTMWMPNTSCSSLSLTHTVAWCITVTPLCLRAIKLTIQSKLAISFPAMPASLWGRWRCHVLCLQSCYMWNTLYSNWGWWEFIFQSCGFQKIFLNWLVGCSITSTVCVVFHVFSCWIVADCCFYFPPFSLNATLASHFLHHVTNKTRIQIVVSLLGLSHQNTSWKYSLSVQITIKWQQWP